MMTFTKAPGRSFFARRITLAAAAAALSLMTGCASHYLDASTKGVEPAEFTKPAQPAPVQLVFDFESKGVVNARATDFLKEAVKSEVQKSGLFASVDDKPATGGALLEVKINNIPLTDDAFSKGLAAGFTFGLAGAQVSDGYVCTVRYLNGDKTIIKTARHAIHTTVGNAASPGNAVKINSLKEGVLTMTRQILSTALNDLSKDPAFQ
ncbi:hypothetical protein [Variovorax terrae]|uniref:DUF4410 domain-containing protein n=1 Tax=Variovorax terrae TaxID=2923278 RepID=A0A9X2AN73_9BURK|nr:hypothetical protein [Variovorax terrae]MCJ0763505.1 hypothetical protein [Variovorax terrae]